MLRRLLPAAAILFALAGCGSAPTAQSSLDDVAASHIDVATPDMVALKAASKVEPCPEAQTTNGGLPAQTLKCLGGGRSVDLSALKGPLVINVFQAACEACIKEEPALAAFHKKYAAQYPILGIDGSDTYPGVALREAIQRGVTYPMVADPGGDLQGGPLNVLGFPTFFFLHEDGTITRAVGGKTSEAEILAMVQEQFAPKKAGGQSVLSVVLQTLGGFALFAAIAAGAVHLVRRRTRQGVA